MGFKKEEKKVEVVTPPQDLEKEPLKEGEEETNLDENEEVVEEEILTVEDSSKDLAKRIDEKREEFNKFAKKMKTYNYILTGILLAVLVAALVIALTVGNKEDNSWVTIVVLVVAIALLVASFVFSKFQRKKMDAEGNKYVEFVLTELNKEIYDDPRFSNKTFKLSDDLKSEFDESRIFLNIKGFKAINISEGELDNVHFKVFDCAASVMVKNRPSPRFLGRMFVFNLPSLEPSIRGIFQLKGGEYSYPVDDTDGLTLYEGNNKFSFYGNNEKVKEVLNNKVLGIIKKIKIDKTIIDVIVSVNNSKLFIGFDYSDDFINVPTKDSINLKHVAKAKADLNKVIDIINNISITK